MEANPYAIHLGGGNEYGAPMPATRGPPPPPGAGRQKSGYIAVAPPSPRSSPPPVPSQPHPVATGGETGDARISENPYGISLGGNTSGGDEYGSGSRPVRIKDTMEGKTTKKVCTAKLIMCAFAIGMLWLTTFQAAQGFVDAAISEPLTPADAISSWNDTFVTAENVKTAFETCVEDKNQVCLNLLNGSTLNELQWSIDQQTINEDIIATASSHLADCQAKTQQKHEAIKIWYEVVERQLKLWRFPATCDNATKGRYLAINDGNSTAQADAQALSITQNYQNALADMAAQTRSAWEVRQAYDRDWASNHTPNVLGNLSLHIHDIPVPDLSVDAALARMSPADLASLEDIKNQLGPDMNRTWDALVLRYDQAKTNAEKAKNATKKFQADYQLAMGNMTAYIQQTQQWFANVQATLAGAGVTWNSGISGIGVDPGISFGQVNVPDLNMPGFDLDTSAFDAGLNNSLTNLQNQGKAKAAAATQSMKDFFANLSTRPVWFDCFACDYNPPPLIFPTEDEDDQENQDFNNQLKGLLTNLNNAATSASVAGNKLQNNSIDLPSLEFVQAQRSKADLKFALLSGNPDFTNLLAGLAQISSLLVILDYLYRVFRSASIFVRYWFGSAVGLPDVEINKQKSVEVREPIGVRIVGFLTSPYFVAFLLLLILFGIVYVILGLYVPFVQSYVASCGSPQQESGPGDLLSINSYALVYNQAVGNGQKTMQNHLTDYDSLRQQICGQYVTQTGNVQDQLQQLLDQIKQDYAANYDQLLTMQKCTDDITAFYNFQNTTNELGLAFRDATGKPVPFDMLGGNPYYRDSAVVCGQNDVINITLLDMTFNCSHVALCTQFDICTSAIDRAALRHSSWKASCDSEKLVLIGITKAGMSFLVYVLWNLGRMFIVMAVGRLLWRHLVPHGFNYVATCSTEGRIDRNTEKEVTKKLAQVIKTFERWGIFWLVVGILIQFFWLVPIIVFGQEIASISAN